MARSGNRYAPIFVAIAILILPVLYVGSYLVLVVPPHAVTSDSEFWRFNRFGAPPSGPIPGTRDVMSAELINQDFGGEQDELGNHYRWGGARAAWFFWPLEQIDRYLR